VEELCSGADSVIPSDIFASSSTVARAAVTACDIEEMCSGSDATIPVDTFQPTSHVARAAASVCDLEEFCTGIDSTIPNDLFVSVEQSLSARRRLRSDNDRRLVSCDGLGNIIQEASPASRSVMGFHSALISILATLSLFFRR
jgi:hypothetical protein